LEREACSFSFFQAVRLLERLNPEREPVGGFVQPSTESVRFGAHPSLAFPASEIQSIAAADGEPPQMLVNFIGLTGALGVLPLYYTELVMSRIRENDTTLRDFFDVFNHRITSLFYRAWKKYRFTVGYEQGERDRFSSRLLHLIGLGTPGLQNRLPVLDDSLIYYSGLLVALPRSAAALQQLLEDYFDVPVEVEQFAGSWYPLDTGTQCCLDDTLDPSAQLGLGAVVGDEMWDHQSVVRIRIGPLLLNQYRDFLPGGKAHETLRALTRFFSGNEIDYEVQLVLAEREVPACELGKEGDTAPTLGWLTWMKSAPLQRDAEETILRL
jgi:type VI secretion system protein ImpH